VSLKFIDVFRDPALAHQYIEAISKRATRQWRIMEIYRGQTHSIIKNGIDQLLKSQVTPVHGPGGPVCVTPIHIIDQAIELASQKNVILRTYGDLLSRNARDIRS
jgi:hydrogenase expression/formation protein HypD